MCVGVQSTRVLASSVRLQALPSFRVYREKVDAFVELIKAYQVGKHSDPKLSVQAAARMVGLEIRPAYVPPGTSTSTSGSTNS